MITSVYSLFIKKEQERRKWLRTVRKDVNRNSDRDDIVWGQYIIERHKMDSLISINALLHVEARE